MDRDNRLLLHIGIDGPNVGIDGPNVSLKFQEDLRKHLE